MATTTNYSWTTPDDTDLVKDGAAAIRTLGSSADTTVKALNPGTTAGDIDYYTTSTAKARVGIGTAGQVLAVNSGATAPEWTTLTTGGMTLINTGGTTLTGATVTIGSIPGTYKNLQLVVQNFLPATDNSYFGVRVNNDSNANRHKMNNLIAAENVSFDDTHWACTGGSDNAVSEATIVIDIWDYANSATWKMAQVNALANYHGNSSNMNISIRQLGYNQTGAITSLVLFPGSGNFTSGTAYLYGVK